MNPNIDPVKVGARLKAAREKAGLTLEEACLQIAIPDITPDCLVEIEAVCHFKGHILFMFSKIYHCSVSSLVAEPLPYTTEEEWLTALHDEKISEGRAAEGLGCTRLNVRLKLEQLHARWIARRMAAQQIKAEVERQWNEAPGNSNLRSYWWHMHLNLMALHDDNYISLIALITLHRDALEDAKQQHIHDMVLDMLNGKLVIQQKEEEQV